MIIVIVCKENDLSRALKVHLFLKNKQTINDKFYVLLSEVGKAQKRHSIDCMFDNSLLEKKNLGDRVQKNYIYIYIIYKNALFAGRGLIKK